MNTMISIDVTLESGADFGASGRERRAAVARALQRVFAGRDWRRNDGPVEAVFDAVEIEQTFACPEERALVTVTERPAPGLRLYQEGDFTADTDEYREAAREILLYLEAVAMAFADRDISDREGLPAVNSWYEGVLPWSEAARRVVCRRAGEACADLAALLDGRAPSAGEKHLRALGVLETVAEALERLNAALGPLRPALGPGRFRETAAWSGAPARVRGVYRPSVWERVIRRQAAELGDEEADFMYECVRDHRAVWPLGVEFAAEFFPLALKLFRLAADQGGLHPAHETEEAAGGPYPVWAEKSV